MILLMCLYSLALCFLFNPLYDNYTSLLNSQYVMLYYTWILLVDFILVKEIQQFFNTRRQKFFIYLISSLFIMGSYFPYQSSIKLFSLLHIVIPILCIIVYIDFLFCAILQFQKKEPIKAQSLIQWFFWGLSVIAMFIIYFGHINGIIEITIIFYISFITQKMKIICVS